LYRKEEIGMDVASASQTLGKDEFLKLFTYQLRSQDPLNPMDSASFTAQLAQFSSLEQLFNMNDRLEDIVAYQTSLNNGVVAGLIGRIARTYEGVTGTVTGVSFEEGTTYLILDNDERVALGEVQEIYAK
jgi:flagellar basal-body rod modification protein FlgD